MAKQWLNKFLSQQKVAQFSLPWRISTSNADAKPTAAQPAVAVSYFLVRWWFAVLLVGYCYSMSKGGRFAELVRGNEFRLLFRDRDLF